MLSRPETVNRRPDRALNVAWQLDAMNKRTNGEGSAFARPASWFFDRSLHFVCDMITTRVEVPDSPFTLGMRVGTRLRLPVAHGEGCYYANEATLRELNERQQVLLRYCDEQGRITPAANPNGSLENIAGICNRERNIFGLMPHPDRACEERLGSSDGAKIFQSMLRWLTAARVAAA